MISVQKTRISNLSDLVSRLSSVEPVGDSNYMPTYIPSIQQQDRLIVDQLLKINQSQYPVYLAQNPFPLKYLVSTSDNGAERLKNILHSIPSKLAVEYASATFAQLFRTSSITELVQTLRKSIHNRQFLHSIENFACTLFNAGSCRLFTLQPQQNQMVSYIDNDRFTLQVPLGRGIVGCCAKAGKVVVLQSTKDSSSYDPEIDDYFNIGDNAAMLIPIFDSSSNFVISVLLVHTPKVGAFFSPEDLEIGLILSTQISPFLTSYVEHMEKNDDRVVRQEIAHGVNILLGKNTLEELLPTILSVVQHAVSTNDAELYMYDSEQKMLYVFEHQVGADGTQFFARKYFKSTSGVPMHVIQTLQVLNFSRLNPEKCEYFSKEFDLPALGQSLIAVPVFGIDKKPIAVLTAYGKRGANMFSSVDVSSLQQIAVQIGVNITNILAAQAVQSAKTKSNNVAGNFEKPMRAIISAMSSKNPQQKKYQICETVAKEIAHAVNCDLVAIWDIDSNNKIKQQFILKSTNPYAQTVNVPPLVQQAISKKETLEYSVASELRNMLGTFDEETNYKSYSNITFPCVSSEVDDCKWVIMCENSLNAQGRFSEQDKQLISDFSLFLVHFGDLTNALNSLDKASRISQIHKSLFEKLIPTSPDITDRLLNELATQLNANDFALYHIDNVSEQLSLISAAEGSLASKNAQLSQGLVGQVATNGQTVNTTELSKHDVYNAAVDSLGKNPENALIIKISDDLVLELTGENAFTQIDEQAAMESKYIIAQSVDITKNLGEAKSSAVGGGVSTEERASFMSRASAPTRSDIEEYSDRLFNILSYNDDDRMIMILKLFVSQGVIRKLQVPFQKLTQFICSLRSCYNVTPYHNWTHACDVMQFVFSCIIRGHLRQYLNDLEIFALLLAAICHDVDHHGLNNAFHKKARTPLGILYEDKPVMEMHHCATAIRLLAMPEHDILEGIESYADKCHFYEFFIKIILATDMEKHMQYIKDFEEVTKEFDKRNEKHRLLLAQIVIKAGDLSNTTRAFDTAAAMATNLMEEFFKQGDLESKLGVEITPMCDRSKATHISCSQVGFYGFCASPLLTALGKFITSLADNTEQLEKNKRVWEQQKIQWEQSQQQK
ncbi:3'5'-cyclic nucleotide phosphodiesterase family protein [Trichomonas vaginalis G3]|uniref:Phosphodiesterase n=1 Tax=Trichomonas vaginalis (strain ATCC PRA-98 / G3) TaxID=412133 RepID=A2F9J4_TRIV3|nr:3',5'-cyclic-nucleotide phosphodiesterase protein [Trichomonas vaginalis G3]EAX98423.1 3'5'-cyclic nucleotide phosphodiesterase family protein [Trichomonas vaginalis G3]KAI5526269.1 3',5'-cyclic-nucleotide phosphodiesterase protein [Trichomonas vaginalis G3]|eukprot:XP_001311353.1 3'5'-cyclic nucleotide phosphodiesterase family protein [Trichomonas vaginalis G3]